MIVFFFFFFFALRFFALAPGRGLAPWAFEVASKCFVSRFRIRVLKPSSARQPSDVIFGGGALILCFSPWPLLGPLALAPSAWPPPGL